MDEERPASPQSRLGPAAHGPADGLRVPPQVLAVGRCLREPEAKKHCLCVKDDEKFTTPLVATADYGYFRLRDEGYTDDDLLRWAETIAQYALGLNDVFVYFKHEDKGVGPEFARKLIDRLVP